MFDDNKTLKINAAIIVLLMSVTLVMLFTFLYSRSNNLDSFFRLNAPQGQTLYVLSKLTALGVYLLLWWQIMLGIFKSLNTRYHIILGVSVLLLVILHVALFVSAASARQGELAIGMLLPDFTSGYYQSGLSFGVIALLCIVIVAIFGVLKNRLPKHWKFGHGLVYVTFALVSIHGSMIGSEISSSSFSYFVYGAVSSLIAAYFYRRLMFLNEI